MATQEYLVRLSCVPAKATAVLEQATHLQQKAAITQLPCPHIDIAVIDADIEGERSTPDDFHMILGIINDQVVLQSHSSTIVQAAMTS